MKSKIFKKVMSGVLSGAMVLTLFSDTTVFAALGYWPEDLPISNEYYYENETLQPYGACFQIDELKNWSPDNDPDARYNRSAIPLQERWMGPSVNPNASRDAKVMPLGGTSPRASQGPSQGGNDVYSYAFTHFQYVDNYNYWGGSSAEGPIAIPTPEHIDSAHKNGVKATGTIFIPWGDYTYGSKFIDELVEQKEDGTFPAADKLIEIAQYYGFDGYIINQESSSSAASMAKFKEMLAYIQEIKPEHFVMSWYNGSGSLNDSSIKNWLQDGDTRINDEWWLDMSWSGIDNTINAAKSAGRSPYDIHASWENFPYTDKGGPVSNLIGPDNKLKVSLGILGPGSTLISSSSIEDFMNNVDPRLWTGPTGDPRNTERKPGMQLFCGFSSLIADQTPIIGEEFTTNFTAGNGYKFYENGVVTGKNTGWFNRSLMDVMPTWRWIVDSEGSKLKPIIDYADAWWGGTSLKVSGNLDANKSNTIRLYSTQLDITADSKVSVTYKTPKDGVDMYVGLCFGEDYAENNFIYYPITVTASSEWATSTVSLADNAGKKAIAISFKYVADSDVTDYSMNVGHLAFTTNETAIDATSKITLDESIYINDTTAEARIYWEKVEGASLYMIHRVHPDGTREFIGATPSDAFYLGKFVKDGDETNFNFEVTSYSANGTRGGANIINFKWPMATNGFEVSVDEGVNLAFRVPAVDDGAFDPGGKIDKINDGVIPSSKWCSSKTNASAYLDLGKEYDISRWVVKHANVQGAGEGVDFNTDSFSLQYAPDDKAELLEPDNLISKNRVIGLKYTKVDEVIGNRQDITDRILNTPIKARYIRLHVTKSDNCPWHAIRIYEFELYENAYFPHSQALLERNVTVHNNQGANDTVIFNNVPMPISGTGGIAVNTGVVKIYDSLTAETPIGEVKAVQPNELYKQRNRGIAIFENINLKAEGGRLYYTTQENDMTSLRYSVEYAPETGTAIKSPTSIKLEHSQKGNQTRSKYGVLTLEGLDVGTSMKVYESADSKSPILHSRPVQEGEDIIRQERIPLIKDGGTIYYELKQSGKPDSGRLEYTYGLTNELNTDQESIKDLVSRYNDLEQAKYSIDTWTEFAQALQSVKELVGLEVKAGDYEVMRVAVEKAVAGLRRKPEPTVTEVIILPDTAEVEKGDTMQFTATVMGENDPSQTVNWIVTGGIEGTSIDENGLLSVALAETAESLTVSAISVIDNTKSSTASVTVTSTSPVFDVPEDIIAEATSPEGAVVEFQTLIAKDLVDGDIEVICNPPSGSTFPMGTTTVECSVTNSRGNETKGTFNITVQDTTAPELNLPMDITVFATKEEGADVTFDVSAVDIVDGPVDVIVDHASGVAFAPGETIVTCTAVDKAGNVVTSSFTVTVKYDYTGYLKDADPETGAINAKAGSAVPIKFSLGGFMGMDIFKYGYPRINEIEANTPGNSKLSYDSVTEEYVFVWKTDKEWEGTEQILELSFIDGTAELIKFNFK